jgi:hypothetical protein
MKENLRAKGTGGVLVPHVSVSATGDFGGTTNGAAAILDGKF